MVRVFNLSAQTHTDTCQPMRANTYQHHIVNDAVGCIFNLILGLADLGQLVQVIDSVVVHLILAVGGGHITRRGTDATVRPVSTCTATIRSPPWRILPGAARGAHGHARKQGKLARRAGSTYGRRLVGYVALRARCAPGFGFRVQRKTLGIPRLFNTLFSSSNYYARLLGYLPRVEPFQHVEHRGGVVCYSY